MATGLAGCTGDGDGGGDGGDGGGGDGGGGDGGGGGGTVRYLTDYANEQWQARWDNELIPGFESETNYNVEIEYAGAAEDLRRRLATLVQSGDPPELTQALLPEIGQYIFSDQLATSTDTIPEIENVLGGLSDSVRDKVTTGGEAYLIPHATSAGEVLHYRGDVYEELGLSEPETWDDLRANTKAIAESDMDIVPFSISGVKGGGKSNNDFLAFLRTAGGGAARYTSDAQDEIEVWYDEEHTTDALAFMDELAEYSPDPSSVDWSPTLKSWAGGRVAQTVLLGAWGAGVAANAGVDEVASNTEVAVFPRKDGADPLDHGYVLVDGYAVMNSDNVQGAKEFVKYNYATKERAAKNYIPDPTRYMPSYPSILETDAYQSADIFQKYDGHLLDLNRKVINEILPKLGSPNRPFTSPSYLAVSAQIIRENANMVNAVLVQDKSPKQAYDEHYPKFEDLIAEGKEQAGDFGN